MSITVVGTIEDYPIVLGAEASANPQKFPPILVIYTEPLHNSILGINRNGFKPRSGYVPSIQQDECIFCSEEAEIEAGFCVPDQLEDSEWDNVGSQTVCKSCNEVAEHIYTAVLNEYSDKIVSNSI